MIKVLENNLHTKGPNVGKPNCYLVSQMYPEYSRKMLRNWCRKKDVILNSHHKHKRLKLDVTQCFNTLCLAQILIINHLNQVRIKFTKHGLTRHINSCVAKMAGFNLINFPFFF